MKLKQTIVVRFVCAEPELILSMLPDAGIEILQVKRIDSLTFEITVAHQHLTRLKKIFSKRGISFKISEVNDSFLKQKALLRRPVLIIGLLLFLIMSLVLPKRILFVRVTGNCEIPARQIMQQIQDNGIIFGVKASTIRSEDIKNELLMQVPELQWVGINTTGCVANVHVRERKNETQISKVESSVVGIVAGCDGLITEINAYQGSPLVRVGQTVKKGELLISGYTDLGRIVQVQPAVGEVFAYTFRQLKAITPKAELERGECIRKETSYRLCIGKKVINLWNHSGIHDATCVKMYSENFLALPGNFRLPVSVITVRCFCFAPLQTSQTESTNQWLPKIVRDYLASQMIAGQILGESFELDQSDDAYRLSGEYACHEMIGRVKREEIIDKYAEDN